MIKARLAHKFLLAGIFMLAIGALLLDTTWMAPIIERRIAAETGRDVHIGDVKLRVGRCLRITVEELRVSNPDWAKTRDLIDSQRLSGCAAWPALFVGRLDFEESIVDTMQLGLEREGDRVTWEMDEKADEGPGRVSARHISVVDSRVLFRDENENTELVIDVSGGIGNADTLRLEASGRVRDAPMEISATTPARLPDDDAPAQVSARAVMGKTTASAEGHFSQMSLEGMDIELTVAGDDMSSINQLGINLPATPPYKLHGRLTYSGDTWNFSPFEGRIGDSDIRGELAYSVREPRPLLSANIDAELLDFDDLGPMVGAPPKTRAGETASDAQKAQAEQVAARGRVLPISPLGVAKLPRMDADVRFRADRVLRPNALPLTGLNGHLLIEDGTLRLQPLEFEIAGGRVTSQIVVEGRTDPPRTSLSADVDSLELARMFPKLDQQNAAAGRLFGHVKLTAHGDSIASMAGSSNGEVTLLVNGGHMSALLLEMAGLDAGESLLILLTRGDEPVPLRCAIADFNLENGQATPELAVVDTTDTVFIVDGAVILDEEELDLTVTPQPKDRSIPAVRTPLLISGHFSDPAVKPQASQLLARGGAAVLLALVNPLLAVIPLIETGPGKDSDCAAFARLAQREGVNAQSRVSDYHNTEVWL